MLICLLNHSKNFFLVKSFATLLTVKSKGWNNCAMLGGTFVANMLLPFQNFKDFLRGLVLENIKDKKGLLIGTSKLLMLFSECRVRQFLLWTLTLHSHYCSDSHWRLRKIRLEISVWVDFGRFYFGWSVASGESCCLR